MNDQIQLHIADVQISIRSSQVPILPGKESAYLDFEVSGRNSKAEADIEVDLKMESPPDVFGWKKIFDDEESWTAYRHNYEYLLQFTPVMHGKDPLWVAHLHKNSSQVVVYCNEKLIRQTEDKRGLLNPVRYPLDQYLMMYHLSNGEGALIHAAGWRLFERGYIFPGKSGAGKSTLSRLFSSREPWQGLSDDRVLVRKMGEEIHCFGTPWPGKEGHALNSSAKLSGIFFLRHDGNNRIRDLNPGEALRKLMPVVSIPWYDQETCLSIIQFCEDVLSQIPAYELRFTPTVEIIDSLEDFIDSERVKAA